MPACLANAPPCCSAPLRIRHSILPCLTFSSNPALSSIGGNAQPTNPTHQPANQQNNRSTNQSANQPTDRPTDQSTDQPTALNQPTYQSTKQPTNQPSTNQGIVDDDSPPLSQSATDSLSVPPRHMLLRHWQQRPSEHTQSHTTCTNSILQHKATPHVLIRLRSQPHSQLPAQIHTRHHSGLHTQLRLSSSSVSRSASCSFLLVILGLNFLLVIIGLNFPCSYMY